MKVKIWKNFPIRKGTRIANTASPEVLVEIWNSISNMGNLKTDAPTEMLGMMAGGTIKRGLEYGATPFTLHQRKGYQVIQAEVEV